MSLRFQVVEPSLESVLIGTSRVQLAMYVQSESSTQAIDALARTLPALDGAGIIEAVW